jgi:hypothetical protein
MRVRYFEKRFQAWEMRAESGERWVRRWTMGTEGGRGIRRWETGDRIDGRRYRVRGFGSRAR